MSRNDNNAELAEVSREVKEYWNSHTLGLQYLNDHTLEIGSKEFFENIRPWMNPFKFPDVMPRIDRIARRIDGKQVLEIGCGMGFDSVELMKRGAQLTATDLTPSAIELACRHFRIMKLTPVDARVANVLDLDFPDEKFDAVYSIGVVHHTGDTPRALQEIRRVLKPGGLAVISHIYRRPSFFYALSRIGRENIEFKEEDAPVADFFTENEVLGMLDGFEVEEMTKDHFRALPIARQGFKAALYTFGFKPFYNLLPVSIAKRFAHKISFIALKA
jgi:2-polyprenyl-3-methyl-5-hydroxy-6-metoxy-1,4-benzoquinol methylase